MNYQETLDFLFQKLPMYQRIGQAAFKKDLTNIIALCEALGNPQESFPSVHIAGTNGKGSSAHMLLEICQEAGYRTGMYTSPHLKSFTERIRVGDAYIEELFVIDFIDDIKSMIEEIQPSFFEITVAMAFAYFAKKEVDIAIIEVGLGGRLDSTNIITPEVCLITNISLDHTEMLGNTVEEIAVEKAGIIKKNVPVVIGESDNTTRPIFLKYATTLGAPISFAGEETHVESHKGKVSFNREDQNLEFDSTLFPDYQVRNIPGVLQVLSKLETAFPKISNVSFEKVLTGFFSKGKIKGRWQQLGVNPLIYCDTAHNYAGVKAVLKQLNSLDFHKLWIIWGMVNDKAIEDILKMLPIDAEYIFCQATVPRALPAEKLKSEAGKFGISGRVITDVNDALITVQNEAGKKDVIFIGGSTFVVADLNEL